MPTWTRPTTDTGADETTGPDPGPRPAEDPEPTTTPDASADTGRAHNPTAGPDTRPGADAPGPPRT